MPSLVLFAERALIGAELQKLNRELGPDAFPVVPQCFFAGHEEMMYTQEFPAVLKVGAAHAGMGKAKVLDHHAMADMRSLLAVSGGRYATAERFIESAHEFRVQKIGGRIRAFKRLGVSGDWKTNTGYAFVVLGTFFVCMGFTSAAIEERPIAPKHGIPSSSWSKAVLPVED